MKITPNIEEIQDSLDSVDTCLKWMNKPEEEILFPNKPASRKIMKFLSLAQDDWVHGSTMYFRNLYVHFGQSNGFLEYRGEFSTYKEWESTRPLAVAICLLGIKVFPRVQASLLIPELLWWHTPFSKESLREKKPSISAKHPLSS
ncbi:hypothetical protein HAX54_013750 [Datura stramonium]|uniref:Uncharacterized protein n=1 Tax=Datura stramonium TaxID=4076 RepID=A0ABS8TPK5_DATST|nr:hypothetical protein [Datura stramonium]